MFEENPMKRMCSVSVGGINNLIIVLLFLSTITAQPVHGAAWKQTEQPTPSETQTPEAAVETPTPGETLSDVLPTDIPVISETQTPAPVETEINLTEEAQASPTASIKIPTQPAVDVGRPSPQPAAQNPDIANSQPLTSAGWLTSLWDVQANAITAGDSHSCALTTDGGVMCWGDNYFGQLGNNTTTDSRVPVNVYGLNSGVKAIAAGDSHTCALTTAGGVMCWGFNYFGQLGNNTTTDSLVPENVFGLSNGVQAITARWGYTCALTTGGGVKCWGYNNDGELGNNTTTDSRVPVNVYGLTSGVKAITTGHDHTCALTTGGGVKCWGSNYSGQLGNNTITNSRVPVNVFGLPSGVKAIAAGGVHNCALTLGGGVKCWGLNGDGQLGNNTTTNSRVPVNVFGLSSGVQALAAGGIHNCVLMTGGGAKCWGFNKDGQLGNNITTNSRVPVNVIGMTSGVKAITAGYLHTCALTAGGGVKCWGYNYSGQLGNNTTTDSSVPVDVVGFAWSPGFDAQFNGNLSGWGKVSGSWTANSTSVYSTALGSGGHASVAYTTYPYTTLDYSVRLMRTGCNNCATKLLVRGSAVASAVAGWTSGYQFNIKRNGYYYVGKIINGSAITLKNWTYSPYINKGNAWNVLRVVAKGGGLGFSINGHPVWAGYDYSLNLGKTGVDMWSDGSGGVNRVFIDYATLTTTINTSLSQGISSMTEKPRLPIDANGGNR